MGEAPKRALVPMTDTELATVKQTVVTRCAGPLRDYLD